MKARIILSVFIVAFALSLTACAGGGLFGSRKRGCPSNSAQMGAERVLAGEKPEKKSKYKIKGMN